MILLPKEPIARPPYIIYRGNDPESRQFPLLKTGESVFGFPSVADPGCLSRILIFTHPETRISDPGSKNSN
jgi:hypothetical protein